ncbi:hypothetical protein KKB18_03565, partial [bacterium]|nr:hypothetical protein [bacterium]
MREFFVVKEIKILLSIALFLLAGSVAASAQWFESESPVMGNMYFSEGYDISFTEIPDSPYLIVDQRVKSLLTFEIDTGKFRGSLLSDHYIGYSDKIVLPDPFNGWDIIYATDHKYGLLKIDAHGEFREDKWLSETYTGLPRMVAVPQRSDVWCIGDKILRLNIIDETWTEFYYPLGWDREQEFITLFQTEDKNTLFIKSKGKTSTLFQALILDLETGHSKILGAESDFVSKV